MLVFFLCFFFVANNGHHAIMPAGVAGWVPYLIEKARCNTLLSSLIPKFRHEWHVKTHCYTLKNKQQINKLSTNVYVKLRNL